MAVRRLSGLCSRHLRTDVTARLAEQIDADGQGQNTADDEHQRNRDHVGQWREDQHAERQVVPEFLRTLVFARPRGDDQFADCTFSPSLDMSR